MTFKELAEKLNELMKKKGLGDEKAIPYLGWYWRDIDPDIPRLILSYPETYPEDARYGWIDEARKWSYPTKVIEGEDAIKILELCIATVECRLELIEKLSVKPERKE